MTARYLTGLLGYPVEHSFSPRLHAAALRACGLEGEYRLFEVFPGVHSEETIRHLLAMVREGEIHGLNVTIPYKQTVLAMLDELTDSAVGIGAVNTIYMAGGKLVGENTDAGGFLSDLKHQMAAARRDISQPYPPNSVALVLGAGGSARAVVYALFQAGWHVRVAARRVGQAEELALSLGASTGNAQRLSFMELSPAVLTEWLTHSSVRLIVNTTPLGMVPNQDSSPWPEGVPFPQSAFLYDLVYNPAETRLMRAAREAGLPVAGGLGMLIEQAVRAFVIWTSCTPSPQAMQQAIDFIYQERIGNS